MYIWIFCQKVPKVLVPISISGNNVKQSSCFTSLQLIWPPWKKQLVNSMSVKWCLTVSSSAFQWILMRLCPLKKLCDCSLAIYIIVLSLCYYFKTISFYVLTLTFWSCIWRTNMTTLLWLDFQVLIGMSWQDVCSFCGNLTFPLGSCYFKAIFVISAYRRKVIKVS